MAVGRGNWLFFGSICSFDSHVRSDSTFHVANIARELWSNPGAGINVNVFGPLPVESVALTNTRI